MKKALHILLALLVLASATGVATAQVQQQKCPTCGKPYSECPYKFEHPVSSKKCPTCGKTIDKCQYNGKHPAPPKKCSTCGKTLDKCQYGGKHPAKCSTCGKTVDKCQYGGQHPKCSTCGKIIDNCQYGGSHPRCSTCSKVIENCQYGGKHPSEKELRRERVLRELEANMVWVEGGNFTMGNKWRGKGGSQQVALSGFYICKYEVTQELWQAVMDTNIRQQRDKHKSQSNISISGLSVLDIYGEGADYPMYYLSWDDCRDFIAKLNQLTGKSYRMPTEAEWEYAARGGRYGANRYQSLEYSGSKSINDVAWFKNNSDHTTHLVGQKSPNELGLCDMCGNVWEWCQDWYGDYSSEVQTDPIGPSSGNYRLMRGGSWDSESSSCCVTTRHYVSPSNRDRCFGLRLAASSL